MPNAKDNTKMTGDLHLPDTESEFSVEEANAQPPGGTGTQNRGQASDRGNEGAAGRGGKKAGVLKDSDAPTSDTYGDTRDSGER